MVETIKRSRYNGVPVTTHGYPLGECGYVKMLLKGTDRDLLMRNVKTSEDGFIQVPSQLCGRKR